MEGSVLEPTILMRKKKSVSVSDQEVLMILRAYQLHPCSWEKIIEKMKETTCIESLPDDAKQLYGSSSAKQLKSRISTKFAKIMSTSHDKIMNESIRDEYKKIKDMEQQLVKKGNVTSKETSTLKCTDVRETLMNEMSEEEGHTEENKPDEAKAEGGPAIGDLVDEDPENKDGPSKPKAEKKDKSKKRPLMDIIRENQMAYNTFIMKKIPKIMKAIGVSSSDSETD